MGQYEATSPLTVVAGATVANSLYGKMASVNSSGRAIVAPAADSHIVGVYAQEAMKEGEPVTINQLVGKLTVRIEESIIAGHLVVPHGLNGRAGSEFAGNADPGVQVIGVALKTVVGANRLGQILAQPIGFDAGNTLVYTAGETVANGLLNHIATVSGGKVTRVINIQNSPVIGTFAEDFCAADVSVRINKLTGILPVVAGAAITINHILVPDITDGRVAGVAGFSAVGANLHAFGVALEAAADGATFDMLAQPLGFGV